MQTLPADDSVIGALPSHVGPYRVRALIGRGGGGVVYCGVDPDGREVAVKTVANTSEWGLASLRAEIHALRRVRHRGVVRVLDDGVHEGRPWFAMERIEGVSLADHAKSLAPPPANGAPRAWTPETLRPVLELVADVCRALATVHAAGIVHRDLKPDNVLVRAGGEPVLVDFGLAVAHAEGASRARPDSASVAGTLAYMAPEQVRGDALDARTDLYALGCILFELLTGAPPSRGGAEVMPSRLATGVPGALDALIASLLDPRPRNRIGHADDVAACLESVLAGDAGSTLRSDASGTLRAWLYRPALAGRTEAIARASRAMARLRAGRGSFLVLTGETGIGKTHIAMEIARGLAAEATIVTAASEPRSAAPAPLACWTRLFEVAVDRTRARPSSSIARAVARHLPVLAKLHGSFASFARAGAAQGDARPAPDEVFVALRDLIAALADDQPVVMLLDDVQWADEITLGVLKLMAGGSLRERPVAFLATCRDDEITPATAALLEAPNTERIAVGPLPERDLRELVADMLGVREPPEGVVAWIAARAEGNPFLAAEYLRLVVSEVPMVRELHLPSNRVLPPPKGALEALRTPGSVHEIAGRRLALLDEATLRVAERIALMGGTVDAEVFAKMIDAPGERDAIADLEKGQLLQRTAEGGARLLHDRLRVAAVDRLAQPKRVALHREAAALLARSAEPPHAAVAHHLKGAGLPREALPHIERAGEIALSRAAYEAAARHFDDARSTAAELARDGTTFEPGRRVAWEHGAARAHFGRGDLEKTENRVRDALAVVGIELPRARAGWAAVATRELLSTFVSRPVTQASDRAVLKELSSAASLLPPRYFYEEDILPVLGSSLLSANLARRARAGAAVGPSSHLGAVAGFVRLPKLARRLFTQAYESASVSGEWRDATQALMLESFYHAGMGSLAEAERAARRAADACARTSDPWMLESVETTLSHVEFFTGRFGAARTRAERVTELARERQDGQHEIWGLYLQARSDLPRGHFATARALLEDALRRLAARPEVISEIASTGMLAQAYLGEGDLECAETTAMSFVDLVEKRVPSAYPTIVGYAGAALVLRHLLELAPTPRRRTGARRLAVSLWRFGSMFPIAGPAAHLHTAHLLRLKGHRRAAHHLFLRGAAQASAWSMPYEQALLLAGAVDAAPSPERASVLEGSARRLFDDLGVQRFTHVTTGERT